MQVRTRERIYLYPLLAMVAASPFPVYRGLNSEMQFEFHLACFLGAMLLSIPAVMIYETLVMTLLGHRSSMVFLARQPEYEFSHTADIDMQEALDLICARLESLGFHVVEERNDDSTALVEFSKSKDAAGQSFMDTAIRGEVGLRQAGRQTGIAVRVVYMDTILIDSGESEAMNALARYASLHDETFAQQNLGLTLTSGVLMAMVDFALLALRYTGLAPITPMVLVSLALGSLGLILAGMLLTFRDREHLAGTRLGIAGAYLALLPLLPVINFHIIE